MKRGLEQVYAYLRGPARTVLDEYYRTHNPFEIVKTYTVQPTVTSLLPLSDHSWQVRWTEEQRGRDGTLLGKSQWEAVLGSRSSRPPPRRRSRRIPSASTSPSSAGRSSSEEGGHAVFDVNRSCVAQALVASGLLALAGCADLAALQGRTEPAAGELTRATLAPDPAPAPPEPPRPRGSWSGPRIRRSRRRSRPLRRETRPPSSGRRSSSSTPTASPRRSSPASPPRLRHRARDRGGDPEPLPGGFEPLARHPRLQRGERDAHPPRDREADGVRDRDQCRDHHHPADLLPRPRLQAEGGSRPRPPDQVLLPPGLLQEVNGLLRAKHAASQREQETTVARLPRLSVEALNFGYEVSEGRACSGGPSGYSTTGARSTSRCRRPCGRARPPFSSSRPGREAAS